MRPDAYKQERSRKYQAAKKKPTSTQEGRLAREERRNRKPVSTHEQSTADEGPSNRRPTKDELGGFDFEQILETKVESQPKDLNLSAIREIRPAQPRPMIDDPNDRSDHKDQYASRHTFSRRKIESNAYRFRPSEEHSCSSEELDDDYAVKRDFDMNKLEAVLWESIQEQSDLPQDNSDPIDVFSPLHVAFVDKLTLVDTGRLSKVFEECKIKELIDEISCDWDQEDLNLKPDRPSKSLEPKQSPTISKPDLSTSNSSSATASTQHTTSTRQSKDRPVLEFWLDDILG